MAAKSISREVGKKVGLWGGIAVAGLAVAVLLARWLVTLPAVADFITRYPGVAPQPEAAPVGTPAWVAIQHFLNMLFMLVTIRAGTLIRYTRRPKAYWLRNNKKFPVTRGAPTKISFDLWIHLWSNVLWLVNGLVFVVAIFATGHWLKLVPTTWEVIPHSLSVGLQYLSLNWPAENGWIHYNSLQQLTYFITIFIAAPVAALSGLRISPAWSARWSKLGNALPLGPVRLVHNFATLWFVVFIVTHVTLVLATGALRNLNHMFAARDDAGWLGFVLFAVSLVVLVGAWIVARPMFLKPVAQLRGKVTAR